ncbi:CBS domain-containing protein [Anaerolineales bacterium HSG25]|nr:CBS domain-containing protein [Anaerolineales bacterium HSG25]
MEHQIPESAKRRVRNIMTTDVISVSPGTAVSEIAKLIAEKGITGVPVINEQEEVLGVVTELDMIVRNTHFKMPNFVMILDIVIHLESKRDYEERLRNVLGTRAEQIMSKPAVTIAPSASIEDLANIMVDKRMNPVPVVENGKLVGVVSRRDVIRLMAEESEQTE